MASESQNMVLRTVYLPPELDQQLKAAALLGDDQSKNDLIRELIGVGVAALQQRKDARFKTWSKTSQPSSVEKSVKTPVTARGSFKVKTKSARATNKTGAATASK